MAAAAQVDLFEPTIERQLDQRINYVMRLHNLDPVEKAVLLIVARHYGQGDAVSIAFMQTLWRSMPTHEVYSDRSIKGAVKSLLEVHKVPIGSCRVPGRNGYYLVTSDSDAEEAVRPLKNEIYSLFRRIKILSPGSAFVRKLNGQMEMLMEEVKDAANAGTD